MSGFAWHDLLSYARDVAAPLLQQLQHVLSAAVLLYRGIKIAIDLKNSTPEDGKLRAFHRHLKANKERNDIVELRKEVEAFATEFPMPGL